MLEGYRIKHLFLKMSFDELEATCKREGWRIPFVTEIEEEEINYDFVWTQSICSEAISEEDYKYGVRLGICWDSKNKKEATINKLFKMHCVVLKEK